MLTIIVLEISLVKDITIINKEGIEAAYFTPYGTRYEYVLFLYNSIFDLLPFNLFEKLIK